MELSELTAYAGEKFHMREQHKWGGFPGFSVLTDEHSGKWVALLMRQWDSDSGTEIQRCDIKCGRRDFSEMNMPFLTSPFRMKGEKWVGVIFDGDTDSEVVCRLFDRAVYSARQGVTLVLENITAESAGVYADTALPFATEGFRTVFSAGPAATVPAKIRKVMKLYQYGDGSLLQKRRNFYRQGKFMEDYEDDEPWTIKFKCYFPTYHDLNVGQLRGYFSWRTLVRKGEYHPIAASLAYLYVYELLCGIGADSPEDSLRKMKAFEQGFIDSGIGDTGMRKNLRRWMPEYAVINHLPAEIVRMYVDPAVLARDAALAVLKTPQANSDDAVFSALCTLSGAKLAQSPVVLKNAAKGKHLFAAVWRYMSEHYEADGQDIFTACFGKRRTYGWYPLFNAIYWLERPYPDTDLVLNESRKYLCRNGRWQVECYEKLYFNKDRFRALIHESDRMFRKYLNTGRHLREKTDEAWVGAYVKAVIDADRQADREAAKLKITFNLDGLERIRHDARFTRDSLLTEAETEDIEDNEKTVEVSEGKNEEKTAGKAVSMPSAVGGLDAPHMRILTNLLAKRPVEALIKTHHLMPSVVTDRINEALFDAVGDNVLTCDGERISVVEDYKKDIIAILEGDE